MKTFDQSREKILARIRSATAGVGLERSLLAAAYDAMPRGYVRRGRMSPEEMGELMLERLREYDAEVIECGPQDIARTIAEKLAASGKHVFVAPKDLPDAWLTNDVDWKIDDDLSARGVEAAEGVVTEASSGIAESGTIVLHHHKGEGRRLLSLLPDWHLCVLRRSQLVETLPEYFERCKVPPTLATYISGPSATADIEMTRIKGVHGPRFLVVILVRDI